MIQEMYGENAPPQWVIKEKKVGNLIPKEFLGVRYRPPPSAVDFLLVGPLLCHPLLSCLLTIITIVTSSPSSSSPSSSLLPTGIDPIDLQNQLKWSPKERMDVQKLKNLPYLKLKRSVWPGKLHA